MKSVIKYVTLLMALVLAGTVAFVSVTGLLKLFAGAGLFGAILFWAMEVSKIVLTTLMHTYNKVIKWYYKIAGIMMIVLAMGITSIGIYGFYSSSYKESFGNMTAIKNRVTLIEEKRELITADKELMKSQILAKRERIKDQSSIRGQQETRMDSLYAKNWYTAARRVQKSIDEANTNITKLEAEIDVINKGMGVINDSLTSYNLQIIELNQNNSAATELGSLTYLSDVTEMTMDDVMKWFILLIMVLGDPLAVLLVVLFNIINKSDKREDKLEDDTANNPVIPAKNTANSEEPEDKPEDDAVNDVQPSYSGSPVNEHPIIPQPMSPPNSLITYHRPADEPFDIEDYVVHNEEELITYEPSLSGHGYSMGIDVAEEDSEPIIIKNETSEIVFPEVKPVESKLVALDIINQESNEDVVEEEEEFIDENQLNLFDQPSELPSEEVEEVEMEVVEEEEVIDEIPSELLVEFPENEINDIPEEEINDEPVDEVNDIPDESDFTEEKEVEEKPIHRKDIKGTGQKTEEGYKVKIRNPEDELSDNKERIQEVLDEQARKEKIKREEIKEVKEQDRGFSVPIPDRDSNQNNNGGDGTIFFKRKNNGNK